MSDKEYDLLSKGVVIAWDEGLMTKEEMERALASLDALAAAEQRATDAEATLAAIGGADKATLARKLRRANAATREAEQRATESGARVKRLREACKIGLGVIVRSDLKGKEPREAIAVLTSVLTAPATQPDERAAAERATDERAAEAWADKVALFILHKVTEAEQLTLAEITPNLTAPGGWLSFARLWRADFIIVTGDLVQPTERGMAAMRELLICVADAELDATDGAAKETT